MNTASTTSTWTIAGMTCQHCVASVTEEIGEVDGVSEVVVDLPSGVATVTSSTPLDAAVIRAAVEEAGYTLV